MPIAILGVVRLKLGLCLVLVLFLLGGCASQLNVHSPIDETSMMDVDEGIVVARVINLSAYPLPFNQLTINPEHLNESSSVKPERLLAAKKVLDGSTVFASAVKSGNYSLNSVSSFHRMGDFLYQFWIPAKVSFGTFEVKPNQVTDLGTLIYYPKVQGENYIKVLAKVPETATGEVLDTYFPFQRYDKAMLLSWKADGYEQDNYEEYLSILQNPVTFLDPYMTPSGSLLFLSKLGVILERSKDGEWILDVVDTNLALNSIKENASGDRIVGGSEGRVFSKHAGGEWQDISLDSSYHVDEVLFSKENSVDVLAYQDFKLAVFRGNLVDAEFSWQQLNSFESMSGWQISENQPEQKKPSKPRRVIGAALEEHNSDSFISVYTLPQSANPLLASRKTEVFRYEPETWATLKIKKMPKIDVTLEAGAVEVGVKEPSFWSFSSKTKYFRQDNETGKWHELDVRVWRCWEGEPMASGRCENPKKPARWLPFTLKSIPWFRSENEGVVVATGIKGPWRPKSGDKEGVRILATKDGGDTWRFTDKSLPKQYCSNFINHFEDRILLSCNGASGDFYESFDSGSTWQHVREQQDF